jgi:hypothetical protein
MSKSELEQANEIVDIALDLAEKAYRKGVADQYLKMMIPQLVYDRGMSKPVSEFKPGIIDTLTAKLDVFVETGEYPKDD